MRIIDMHCDTLSEILAHRRKGETVSLRCSTLHLDLQRMQRQGYLLQNFAMFVNTDKWSDPWQQVQDLYELYREELAANSDILAPVLQYGDIAANEAAGKVSALLTVEEGAVCGGDLQKLYTLYEQGVRMMTLTWNHPNEIGYPNLDSSRRKQYARISDFLNTPDTERGLTEKGRVFVEQMEQLGMIVDVSHLSDAGFYDVCECTSKPFVASHSNARSVCPCARNLTDGMIRELAERGGVTGLNFCTDFLEQAEGERNTDYLEAAVRHAVKIVDVGGSGVLGLGSDFDGIDTNQDLPDVQSMERLWDALHTAGFTQRQLDLIFSENVLRVYREVLR